MTPTKRPALEPFHSKQEACQWARQNALGKLTVLVTEVPAINIRWTGSEWKDETDDPNQA